MGILVKAIQRINPRNKNAAKKWFAVQNSAGLVSETKVAELIADETTLNAAEALMSIRQLYKILLRLLLSGNSVKLGNWGTFSITLNCKGVEKKEDLKATDIMRVNINFQPGEEMKIALQKAEFVWIDKLVEGKVNAGGGGSDRPEIE
ncbi:DNA-binding protein [Parabacteroides sp. AF18-52]|jgi:putative DNA-binding protein|uniref:HU family DNA-binding protein n=1 Tax=Parabacteroides TaxID=375288 RepID=UPI000F0097DB|nr:HU family DNA-binding protein [Parabacteroides sp. AF18-52]RHR40171.1 DNA-binding protein [Parabacteroides sp. AF18-52]